MGNKNLFDPGQRSGIQRFVDTRGNWFRVCYWGSGLSDVRIGERIFFQNYRGSYWFGTIERDCFVLISDVPFQRVLDGVDLIRSQDEMIREHASGWFVDQGELPF